MAFGKRHSSRPATTPSASEPVHAPASPGNLADRAPARPADDTVAKFAAAADRILRFLTEAYRDAQGMPTETVLSAAGALAGFAVQEAIWEGVVRTGKLRAAQAFICVGTGSETFFFGNAPTQLLLSTHPESISVWRLVADSIRKSGLHALPDLEPICDHALKTLCTPAYGVPVQVKREVFRELPRDALRHWPQTTAMLSAAGLPPLQWPLAIAVAAQQLICQFRDEVPPHIATLIVMEAAITMARVDPRTVPGGTVVGTIPDKVSDLSPAEKTAMTASVTVPA